MLSSALNFSLLIFKFCGMLKNIDDFSLTNAIKEKIFQVEFALVKNTSMAFPIVSFTLSFLIIFPHACAISTQDIFEPFFINRILGIFSLYKLPELIAESFIPIEILVDLFSLFIILLTVLHFFLYNLNSCLTRTFGVSLMVSWFLIVPLNELTFKRINYLIKSSQATALQYVRFILMTLLVVLNDIIVLIFIKLLFAPLRKNNHNWQLNNSTNFKLTLFLIAQTIIISIDGISVLVMLISIVCIIYMKLSQIRYNFSNQSKIWENQLHVLIAFYIGSTFSLAFNKVVGFQIWVILFILAFITGLLNFMSISGNNLTFPICSAPSQAFYDFFFEVKQKSTSSGTQLSTFKKSFKQIMYLHIHNCKELVCFVRKFQQQIQDCKDKQLEILEEIADFSIYTRRNDSIHNQLLYHLWLCENGKNYKFKVSTLDTYEQQYIRAFSENNLSMVEDNNSVKQANLTLLNKMFFEQIYEAADSFSAFYQEVAKANPRIQMLLNNGQKIETNVRRVKNLFGQLVNHHYLNFKSFQLYLDFLIFFLNEDILDADMITRLKKIQRNNEIQEISQSYLPCLTIFSSTGIIDNVNMQMIKVLNLNKYEIKTKHLSSLIFPQIQFHDFMRFYLKKKESGSLVFLKKNNGQDFVCMKLKIVTKEIQNSRYAHLFFQKQAFSNSTRTMILINSNFQILAITKPLIVIKAQSAEDGFIKIDTRSVFQNDIYILKDRLQKLQIIKIQQITEYPEVNLQIHLLKYTIPGHWVISAKFYSSADQENKILSNLSFMNFKKNQKSKQFILNYDEEFNRPLIRGQLCQNQQSAFTFKKAISMGKFQRDLHLIIVNQTVLMRPQYSLEIKTYRLFGDELYNVDLQDKQAYNQLFEGLENSQMSKTKIKEVWISEYGIVFSIIILCIIMIILGIAIAVQCSVSLKQIEYNFVKAEQIQNFMLDFNRLLSVLREVASGQYAARSIDWIPDVEQSYNRLELKIKNPIFRSTDYIMVYNEQTYKGNLNELVQVVNAHIFELLDKKDFDIIQQIHQASIQYLTGYLLDQKSYRKQTVQSLIISTENFDLAIIIVICVGIVLYYLLLLALLCKLNNSAKQKFLKLMIMSDSHALWYQENAEKVKHLVQMVQKNFEVEMQNFLSIKEQFKNRKKIKQATIGKKITRIVLGVGIVLFALNLAFAIYFNFFLIDKLEYIAEMQKQSEALTQLYSKMCSETNRMEHLGQIRPKVVEGIMDYMTKVENLRTKYYFSDSLVEEIDTIYFQNSCQFLKNKDLLKNVSCSKTCPGYVIEDPFEIGLSNYFRRMHFLVLNDLSQTFASTGIFSELFVRVYLYLSDNMKIQGSQLIRQTFVQLLIYTIVLNLLNVVFIIVAVSINCLLKRKINRVKQLIYFLNLQEKKDEKRKQSEKEADNNRKRATTLQGIKMQDEQKVDLLGESAQNENIL